MAFWLTVFAPTIFTSCTVNKIQNTISKYDNRYNKKLFFSATCYPNNSLRQGTRENEYENGKNLKKNNA